MCTENFVSIVPQLFLLRPSLMDSKTSFPSRTQLLPFTGFASMFAPENCMFPVMIMIGGNSWALSLGICWENRQGDKRKTSKKGGLIAAEKATKPLIVGTCEIVPLRALTMMYWARFSLQARFQTSWAKALLWQGAYIVCPFWSKGCAVAVSNCLPPRPYQLTRLFLCVQLR